MRLPIEHCFVSFCLLTSLTKEPSIVDQLFDAFAEHGMLGNVPAAFHLELARSEIHSMEQQRGSGCTESRTR